MAQANALVQTEPKASIIRAAVAEAIDGSRQLISPRPRGDVAQQIPRDSTHEDALKGCAHEPLAQFWIDAGKQFICELEMGFE